MTFGANVAVYRDRPGDTRVLPVFTLGSCFKSTYPPRALVGPSIFLGRIVPDLLSTFYVAVSLLCLQLFCA